MKDGSSHGFSSSPTQREDMLEVNQPAVSGSQTEGLLKPLQDY